MVWSSNQQKCTAVLYSDSQTKTERNITFWAHTSTMHFYEIE